MVRNRVWIIWACALMIGLSAVACQPAPAPTPPATQPGDPIVFRTAWARMPQSIDPHQHMGTSQYRALFFVYETLVRFKRGTTELEPGLATEWVIAPDLKSVTFTLRRDVTFSDGTPFNAQAVEFNFSRLLGLNLGPRAYMQAAESVDIIDEYKIRFNLSRPSASFEYFVPRFFIISPALVEAKKTAEDPWARNALVRTAVGTGPYILTSWIEGDRLEFARNPKYWGPYHPYAPDTYIHLSVPDAATRVMKLEKGEVDHIADMELQPALAIELLKKQPQIATHVVQTENSVMLMMVNYKGPLQDVRVRKAIAHAFDRESYSTMVLRGIVGSEHPYLVPETMQYANTNVPVYEYDLDKAKQLLAEAGYPNGGFELGFIGYDGWATEEGAGVVLQDALRKLGITLKVWNPSWQVKQDTMNNPDTAWDMASLNIYPPLPHPGNLDSHFKSDRGLGAGYNWALYNNPRVDELFLLIDSTTDPAKLKEYFEEIQLLIVQDCPAFALTTFNRVEAHLPNVDGWLYTPGMGHQTLYLPQDVGKLPTK